MYKRQGNNDNGPDVVRYIMSLGIHKLDIVVGTHPHEDYIGGLDDVIKAFDIGDVYMPKVQHNTKTFRDVLSAVKEKDLKVQTAKAGVELLKESGLEAVVLAPVKEKYEDLNNYSAIIRMVYGNTSFLFTGDAEKEDVYKRQQLQLPPPILLAGVIVPFIPYVLCFYNLAKMPRL